MDSNIFESKVLWSHIDANRHLRHSAYADFAAQARVELLERIGLSFNTLEKLLIGPILFREELIYHREVKLNDSVKVITCISKSNADYSRWSFTHELYRGDGIKAATIYIDGAWLDLEKRKLTVLPEEYNVIFKALPQSSDFVIQ